MAGFDWASAVRNLKGNSTPTHGAPVRMENVPPSLRKMTQEEKANAAMEFLSMTGLGDIGSGVNRIRHSGDAQTPPQTPYARYSQGADAAPSGSGFDFDGAVNAGYSDQEILQHFRQGTPSFDFDGAIRAGYSVREIGDYLYSAPKAQAEPGARPSQFSEILGGATDVAKGSLQLLSPLLTGMAGGPVVNAAKSTYAAIPGTVANKLGWTVARGAGTVLGGLAGAGGGGYVAKQGALAAGADPGTAEAVEFGGSLAGGVLGAKLGSGTVSKAQDYVVGDTIKHTVQATMPRNSKRFFEENAALGNPLVKAQEANLGRPITRMEDYLDAIELAKKEAGAAIEQVIGPSKLAGATIDGRQVVKAGLDALPKTTVNEQRGVVKKLSQMFSSYNRPLTIDEADQFRIEWNAALALEESPYQQVRQDQMLANPLIAARRAMVAKIRELTDQRVQDMLPGADFAAIRKQYGALDELQDAAARRLMVANRQADLNLNESFKWSKAIGRALVRAPIDPLGTAADLGDAAAASAIKSGAKANSKIAKAMKYTTPAPPRAVPQVPRPAGLLGPATPAIPVTDTSGPVRMDPDAEFQMNRPFYDSIVRGWGNENAGYDPVTRRVIPQRQIAAPQPGQPPINLSPNYGTGNVGFGTQHSAAQATPLQPRNTMAEFLAMLEKLQSGQGPKLLGPAKRGDRPVVWADFLEQMRRLQK